MKLILKDFFKGIFLGMLLLPLEFSLLAQPVKAQGGLREQIRSQIFDPRDIRGDQPCEEGREGCGRPIPTHRPSPGPSQPSPEPQSSPEPPGPQPPPSASPEASPSPGPSPLPGVGGPSDEECGEKCEEDEEEKIVEKVIETVKVIEVGGPQIVGLSYTGSE